MKTIDVCAFHLILTIEMAFNWDNLKAKYSDELFDGLMMTKESIYQITASGQCRKHRTCIIYGNTSNIPINYVTGDFHLINPINFVVIELVDVGY